MADPAVSVAVDGGDSEPDSEDDRESEAESDRDRGGDVRDVDVDDGLIVDADAHADPPGGADGTDAVNREEPAVDGTVRTRFGRVVRKPDRFAFS